MWAKQNSDVETRGWCCSGFILLLVWYPAVAAACCTLSLAVLGADIEGVECRAGRSSRVLIRLTAARVGELAYRPALLSFSAACLTQCSSTTASQWRSTGH